MTIVGLVARNMMRNRMRGILTVAGVAVAVLTFLLLRTLVYSWTSAQDYAAKDRVVTRHKITFVMSLPKRYIDDVRGAPGIKRSTFSNWFGGKDPKHDTEFFSTLAVDDKTYLDVYDEISVPPDVKERWLGDRSGALVGDVLARKLGWNVGDKVTLESGIYPASPDAPWTLTISGIYTATSKSVDRSTLLFHWDYMNDALPAARQNEIGWIVSRVTDPTRSADIGIALDKLFDARDIQTLSQDERAFQASFLAGISAILVAVNVISGVILLIMALILGNTVAMAVRERTNEYGVLRAVGFLPRHVAAFIFGEAVLTAAVGAGVGIAIAYPFIEKGLGRSLEENMGQFFPYFRIAPFDIGLALICALLLGLGAAFVPARGAAKLQVTEALRRVV